MSSETCFVIMAIGDQVVGPATVTSTELKNRYDDLIKEAILRARPTLDVTRADDVSAPGTITMDIITRLMHSTFVVADVTYPNPNVFYELGLRHACRAGTIIIRERQGPKAPFDIAHLRYVDYDNTPSGLKALAEQLRPYFSHFDANPIRPDNHFLEIAKLTAYQYPDYAPIDDTPAETKLMMALLESPQMVELIIQQQQGEPIDQAKMMRAIMSNPKFAEPMLNMLVKNGEINFGSSKAVTHNPPSRGPKKRRR